MTGTGNVINLCDWCPTCHRPLAPAPGQPDDLLYRDPTTGRWRHTLCAIAHRKETTTN